MNLEAKDSIRHYQLRHLVKPGITGWAQVNGLRGETSDQDLLRQKSGSGYLVHRKLVDFTGPQNHLALHLAHAQGRSPGLLTRARQGFKRKR